MAISKFLAFDFGAESGRAIVGILDGKKISFEEVHRFPNRQTKILGHLHWDVLALFEDIKKGMSLAVQKGHGDISSIGIDTWGVDFGFVGKDNEMLGFPFCYRDSRTNGMMEKVFEKIPKEEVYALTGIQFMQLNSLYQFYSAKLANPELFPVVDKFLFMPDLFNFLLTGEKKCEYTIASTSQMMNARTKSFDPKIYSALGLPLNIMAPIVMPGSIVGKLLPEVAAETGLKEVDVVAVGCHDTASAIAAVPAQGKDWAYLSSGTWSLVGIESGEPVISNTTFENNFTNEGGIYGTIRFLRNVMGLWLLQETRKSWQRQGEDFKYDELVKLAEEAKEFKCIVDPDDDIFLNPPDMPAAIVEYCRKKGLTPPQTKGEFVRCIFESLALRYKAVIEKINTMTGKKISKLHIVGGGSQNEMLNQFTADACGIPVVAGPVEATALGNILVQAIAKERIGSIDKAREIVANSFPVKTYQPKNSEKWNEVFVNLH
jgi:rhamnulokinase